MNLAPVVARLRDQCPELRNVLSALSGATPAAHSIEFVRLSVGALRLVHDNGSQVAEYGSSVGIGGDSGSPVFWLIGGQLCLVGVWSMTGGILQSLIGQEDALNSKMNELAASAGDAAAGTYAVSTVDLSGFTYYP